MAKLHRHDRAWERFNEMLSEPRLPRGGGCRKAGRSARRQPALGYGELLAIAAELGVVVRPMNDKEREIDSVDAHGNTFRSAGFFRRPNLIAMREESPEVLLHELGHALDYQLGATFSRKGASECVAIGVEYLVAVEFKGLARARPNAEYARRQGVTVADIATLRERIEFIYEYLMDGLRSALPDSAAARLLAAA